MMTRLGVQRRAASQAGLGENLNSQKNDEAMKIQSLLDGIQSRYSKTVTVPER